MQYVAETDHNIIFLFLSSDDIIGKSGCMLEG